MLWRPAEGSHIWSNHCSRVATETDELRSLLRRSCWLERCVFDPAAVTQHNQSFYFRQNIMAQLQHGFNIGHIAASSRLIFFFNAAIWVQKLMYERFVKVWCSISVCSNSSHPVSSKQSYRVEEASAVQIWNPVYINRTKNLIIIVLFCWRWASRRGSGTGIRDQTVWDGRQTTVL